MVKRLVMLLATAGTAIGVMGSEPLDYQQVVQFIEEHDSAGLRLVLFKSIESLPVSERNLIALSAAKSISRGEPGIYATDLLRKMSEKRLITEPQVIPHLIMGLSHSNHNYVARGCLNMLQHLTRRHCGVNGWARFVGDATKDGHIIQWWVDWWEINKNKHPVFDEKLERAVRNDILRISNIIEKEIKPEFSELELFYSPSPLSLRWFPPLFLHEYNPREKTLPIRTFHGVNRDTLPWILITCVFQSQEPSDSEEAGTPRPPKNLRNRVVTCYSNIVMDSGLLVEVKVAAENDALIERIRNALVTTGDIKRNISVEESGPADPSQGVGSADP